MIFQAQIIPKPLPMVEAIDFWRDKVPLTDEEFFKLASDSTAGAFSASGLSRIGWSEDFYKSIDRALSEGTTFTDFKKDLAPTLAKMGWETENSWRLETIFRTNVQTAYQAGRYRWMSANTAERPFWRYVAVDDKRVRPEHFAMNGEIYRADDPIWDSWYPPNGFNCRCTVITLSAGQVSRRGLAVSDGSTVSAEPDPGFDHNPGKISLAESLGKAAFALEMGLVDIGPAEAGLPKRLPAAEGPAAWPAAPKARQIERFNEEILLGDSVRQIPDPLRQPAIVHRLLAESLSAKNMGQAARLVDLVGQPQEIWMAPFRAESGGIQMRLRYVKNYNGESVAADVAGTVVEDIAVDEDARRGIPIYAEAA